MKTSYRHLLIAALFLGVAAVWFGPLVTSLVDQRLQLRAAESELQERTAANENLEHEIDQWNDDAYIKQQARERLLFVEPGDQAFIVIDDREDRDDADQPHEKPESAPIVPSPGPTSTVTSSLATSPPATSAATTRASGTSTTSSASSPTKSGAASSPSTSATTESGVAQSSQSGFDGSLTTKSSESDNERHGE